MTRTLHTTEPHGEHRVLLTEDNEKPGDRIYHIQNRRGVPVGFTGEELESLASWWHQEKQRTPSPTKVNPSDLLL